MKDKLVLLLKQLAQAQSLPYKARAFQKAAEAVASLDKSFLKSASVSKLQRVPGIGASSAKVIYEFITTGRCKRYEEEVGLPFSCDLTELRGVGVKTAKQLYDTYGIYTIAQLEKLVKRGKIKDEKLVKALKFYSRKKTRRPWYQALELAVLVTKEIVEPYSSKYEVCGSLRRLKHSVGDIDIVVVPEASVDYFYKLAKKKGFTVEAFGPKKMSLNVEGFHIDLQFTPEKWFWAAVNYLTGSRNFNIAIRTIAKQKGIKVNEKMELSSEEELFEVLGLPFVPPPAREFGNDEELKGLDWDPDEIPKADFHIHTKFSDGQTNLKALSKLVGKKFEVLGVSDHSLPNPSGIKDLRTYAKKIRRKGLLVGLELDILKDGMWKTSAYSVEDIRRNLDYVILSCHYKPEAILHVKRAVKALYPFPIILGHISGRDSAKGRTGVEDTDLIRLLNELEPYKDCLVIEINAQPSRFDPPFRVLREVSKMGFGVVISSDLHTYSSRLSFFNKLGLKRAMRGLVKKKNFLRGIKVISGKGLGARL